MAHSAVCNVVIHMDFRDFSCYNFNAKKLVQLKYGLNLNVFSFHRISSKGLIVKHRSELNLQFLLVTVGSGYILLSGLLLHNI